MAWNFACPDWEDRLRAGRSLVPSLPLDQKRAANAVTAFNKLRLSDVPGTPALAQAGGQWFRDIVAAVFGSIDPHTNERHVRELFCLVPKKNAKTTYGALLMLTALLLNLRPRARFIVTGPTHDIAQLAFDQVRGAIALDPVLTKLLHVRDHLKRIEHRKTAAELEIMTFDPSALTGQKPAGVLIDEVHVSARMSRADSALRQLRSGMVAQPEAFLIFITTQSESPPVGVFRAELMNARAIRDGRQKGPMLPILYEFPEAMQRDAAQWQDVANWGMVTPNNGLSVNVGRLAADFATAKTKGEAETRAWASQHLNIEIGIALRSDGWAGAQFWDRGADPLLTLEGILERCEVITVGIDGGGTDDLLGVAVLGRERHTRRWLLWAHALVSPEGVERRRANAPVYADFQRDGDLTIIDVPGDLAWTCALVQRVLDAGLLASVGVDAAGTGTVVDALAEIGVSEAAGNLVGVRQGIALMGPILTVERKLLDGTFKHADQALMAWCVGNAVVVPTRTALMITREDAGYKKIDPLIATFNAAALMERNPEASGDLSAAILARGGMA